MSSFPDLIKSAAQKFKNEAIAFTQIRYENNKVKVRMQALEIGKQFVGDVTYGRDPKGILFYNDQLDFNIPNPDFKYYKHGTTGLVTIEVYFYEHGHSDPYARFVARAESSKLPHHTYGEGNGSWTDFRAGSAYTQTIRREGATRLNMTFPALNKTAYLDTAKATKRIDLWGILLFMDVDKLVNCMAIVNPDIIVFHPQGEPNKNIGLFIPAGSLEVGGTDLKVSVTWRHIPPTSRVTAEGAVEGLEEEGLEVEEKGKEAAAAA